MSKKILDGVTVLDLSTFVTGGFCSAMLANQGAEVVKVERPGVGDDNRHSGPPFLKGESPYFWTVNYGKRSLELNLQTQQGQEALYDLVEETDVFIQNYRPGTANRLDVDYDTITSRNEDIVYLAISAFGQTGPWRKRPGYDLLLQGMGGIMDVTGEKGGRPVKVGLPITDLITAMWGAFGVVSALYRRTQTGVGEYIDLGMLESTLPWLTKQAGKVFANETPTRMGTKDPVLAPYQAFETADGYLNVACLNQKLWKELCDTIDREELATDPRFQTNADRVEHMNMLEQELESTFREKSTEEWITVLVEDAGVPAGPVFNVENAVNNPQVDARNAVTETEHPELGSVPIIEHPLNYKHADSGFDSPPPLLGEHNREIFRGIGYSDEEIDALEAADVFGNQVDI